MRARRQIYILCQTIGRPVQSTPHSRRAASQLRPLEPYDASRLILDIEAASSKFVRKYEGGHEDQTRRGPISARTSQSEAMRAAKPESLVTLPNPKEVPDIYRPAPIDLISYALLDAPRKGEEDEFLSRVLSKCLPRGLGGFEDYLQWLRAYEVLPYEVDRLLRVPSEHANEIMASILTASPKYYELCRLTSLLTRTVDGCKFVAANGRTLVQSLQLQEIRRHKKLKYINAVVQRLETMGVDPGHVWYAAGLYNSTKTLHLPALKRYIDIAVTNTLELHVPLLVHLLRSAWTWPFDESGQRRVRNIDARDLKDDLLRLLTGWASNGVREGDELRKPSFALLLRGDWELYGHYIGAIAKLEACDALWYEFNNIDLTPVSGRTSTSDSFALLERAHFFARMFINLRDPLQGLKVLCKHWQMKNDDGSTPSGSNGRPRAKIGENNDGMASDENQTRPNSKPVTASENIPPIPELWSDRNEDLLDALASKYVWEAHVVDEENLVKDLRRLDMYTPEYMASLVCEFSAYRKSERQEGSKGK